MDELQNKLSCLRKIALEQGLPPLLHRPWCQLTGGHEQAKSTITVMQWNILAQVLSQGDNNFVLCPEKALTWEVRKSRVIEEILSYAPDIVCLEEVDTFSYFSSELKTVGYDSMFFPKRNSPCLSYDNTTGPDGCVIMYLTSKLTLVNSENLNIYVPPGRTLCNQVAIMATFEQKNTTQPKKFHVVVTHLKAKSGFEELREKQAQYLTCCLKDKLGLEPIIVCGDFNGSPSEPLYKVFQESELNLTSVYTLLENDKKEPEYTTWKVRGSEKGTKESCSTIDYIWLTDDWFSVDQIVRLPTEEEIGPNRLPSLSYPSDHLSLVCQICLK